MVRRLALYLFGFFMTFAATYAVAEPYGVAVLQGLDKVTGRVSTLRLPIGDIQTFGNLEIMVRTCDKRPPEEQPESAAFLDIWDRSQEGTAQSRFRGWMFASSPGLNGLEHPVYDVWVLDCESPLGSGT
ncbi:MAG: DUF2155 domain-containing protein [Rhodospirillales bacterium]